MDYNKIRKKENRKFSMLDDKLDILFTMMISALFILFWFVLLFDPIADRFLYPFVNHSQGIGWAQMIVAISCVIAMWLLKGFMR